MPKSRPPAGKCVHCLNNFDDLTWDHVFPKSWYPDTTPRNLEKWQIPVCLKCNREYGKLEEDLLLRFSLCFDPAAYATKGLVEKALRSVNENSAKNEDDRKHRAAKRAKIRGQLVEYHTVPTQGIFPNFGPKPELLYDGFGAIHISEESITKFGQKIVRGITYVDNKSFIDESYEIKIYVIEESRAQEILEMIDKFGEVYDRGAGFTVKCAKTEKLQSLWRIEIWERLTFWSTVILKSELDASDN